MLLFRKPSRRTDREVFEKLLYFLSFVCALSVGAGYNLDTESIKVFSDPKSFRSSRESYFGFSTALYTGVHRGVVKSYILVGAPRANVSAIPSVLEPGTVYKCEINDDECVEWNLDPTANVFVSTQYSIINQIKNNAWIGANIGVVNSAMTNIVVCAPRWKNNDKVWFMNGMCYRTVDHSGDVFERTADERLIPLFGPKHQISTVGGTKVYNYGMGQTGASLHLYKDHNRSEILLGNPGVFNWKGTPLLLSSSGQKFIPLIEGEPSILNANYFGYAVSSGSYFQRDDRWFAASAPRANDIMGKVLIFDFSTFGGRQLVVRLGLVGQQQGEYFGGSLASCDVNNDGRDEILIGAPLWSRYMDEGRVYVYSAEVLLQTLEGEVIGGRFGSAITCLGDLDYDGYGDIAIGAPYEDDHGAVYIYNGNPTGLNKRYSQRIAGASISEKIRGFGGAISEPWDVDGNAYDDIAVGAYLSGHVVLLRSQPVVTIRVSVTYLDAKRLQSNTTFFVVSVCSYYDGIHVPQQLNVERILKVDPVERRAFFGTVKNVDGEYKLPATLQQGSHICEDLKINLVEDMKNVIDPIEIGVSLSLEHHPEVQRDWNVVNGTTKKFCATCPVVNKVLSKSDDLINLPFAVDCGSDNVCTSNLTVAVFGNFEDGNRYTLGSTRTTRLVVRVGNHGEPAYNAEAHVFIPSPIFLASIKRECRENHHPAGILEVTCPLGNPLRGEASSVLELEMSDIRSDSDHVEILVNVSTNSINVNSAMSARNFTVYFDVDADIAIVGKSEQDLYPYSSEDQAQLLDSVRFQHVYEVQKFGTSPIEESVVMVFVPTHWKDNDGNSVEIANINQTFGVMEGRTFICPPLSAMNDRQVGDKAEISAEALTRENEHDTQNDHMFERLTTPVGAKLNVPPENRTLYLNCTNPSVKCTPISCTLGTFASSLTVAKLTITIDLQLRNLRPETMETRDIIYFVTNGNVVITKPKLIKGIENKRNSTLVGTTFVGSPIAGRVAVWIIVLSVLFGILLLVLLILGLVKLGFFHRKKKEELEALKAESDKSHGFVLETTSSREVLDKD